MTSFPIGPDVELGVLQGTRADIPPNSLLTALEIGRSDGGDNWLRIWTATLDVGTHNFDLGPELALPPIVAPANNGHSGEVHVPAGCIVSALEYGGDVLKVSYRKLNLPSELTFGPEQGQPPLWTKTPHHDGGGQLAEALGSMLTGFRLVKDPDTDMTLQLWYRAIQ